MNNLNLLRLKISVLSAMIALGAMALDLSHYTAESVLASGRWIKISVDDSGLYRISASTLRSWGFSNAATVRIHGYGGQRIPDALTASNFVDDLPTVSSTICPDGSIVFYAVGPHSWETSDIMVRRSNPYSTAGYYFLTESDSAIPEIAQTASAGATDAATSFTERLQHEQDLVSPGESGQLLVGEDFRYTPTRTFKFDLPDICGPLSFRTSFVAKTTASSSRLIFKANGTDVPAIASDVIATSSSSSEVYGIEGRTTHTLDNISGPLELTITHSSSSLVYNAWLNYIAVNYERSLRLPSSGMLQFSSDSKQLSLSGASSDVRIWDVTDPAAIMSVNYQADGDAATWTATVSGRREYVAWTGKSSLPTPR